MFYVQLGNSHKVYRKRVKRDGKEEKGRGNRKICIK